MLAAEARIALREHRRCASGPSELALVGALLEEEQLLHLRHLSGTKFVVLLPSGQEGGDV
jgi:hypothetical protein